MCRFDINYFLLKLIKKSPEDLENSQLFSEEEKKYILDNLTNESLIKNRLNLSNQINKKEDWNKIREKINGSCL